MAALADGADWRSTENMRKEVMSKAFREKEVWGMQRYRAMDSQKLV